MQELLLLFTRSSLGEAVCAKQFVQYQASAYCKLSLSQQTPAVSSFLKLTPDSNKNVHGHGYMQVLTDLHIM